MRKQAIQKMTQNYKLGSYVEEQMSAIKLVISFGREKFAIEKFSEMAELTREISTRSGVKMAYMSGMFFASIIGVSIWGWTFGGILVQNDVTNPGTGEKYTVADVLIVYYSILYGMITCFQLMPVIPSLAKINVAGTFIFDIIDRDPQIGGKEEAVNTIGDIQIDRGINFENVKFRYPTAPEGANPVIECGNFTIKSGTSTAIVGPSGAGKSTIVQLLNRFYDPECGSISYGSDNIKTLDVTKLREMIGWVGQEPVLIIGTIRENLKYGNADADEEQMKKALQ